MIFKRHYNTIEINLWLFYISIWHRSDSVRELKQPGGFWVRLFKYGRGFCVSNSPLKFSESNGFEKYYILPFGYRINKLKAL